MAEGAYSRAMADLLDTGSVVTDADEAVAMLMPLHGLIGALTDVQRWFSAVVDPWHATPEDTAHTLSTAAKASAPGPSRPAHQPPALAAGQRDCRAN